MESKEERLMTIAKAIGEWSTCIKYKVGALIVRDNRIISTGYNGTAPGAKHCTQEFIVEPPAELHHKWAQRNEIHAEMNAILYAARYGVSLDQSTLIVTHSPCVDCAKAVVQAGIVKVIFHQLYVYSYLEIFEQNGVEIKQL